MIPVSCLQKQDMGMVSPMRLLEAIPQLFIQKIIYATDSTTHEKGVLNSAQATGFGMKEGKALSSGSTWCELTNEFQA